MPGPVTLHAHGAGGGPTPRTPYVHVMSGLPASGKTTAARALLAQAEGRMRRISLDDLRAMLDPLRPDGRPMWSSAHEETTVAMHDACLREAVLAGYDAVVDNTHLTPKATEHLKTAVGRLAWFVVHDLTGVPVEECIARDALRGPSSVGEDVIRLLAGQHAEARNAGWQLTEQWLNDRHDAARAGAQWARRQAESMTDRQGATL
jgi:predicted kinase